ncbi:MAG: RNA 2',3'-cyclic phosphodiesterase [Candidatus Obscuribacterales bacterium]|nr:RNA 2',3'-cyclic phosphodiesterase [Candidatus Obscuribacterales bacterium]
MSGKRLFVGTMLPQATKDSLEKCQKQFYAQHQADKLRTVQAEKLHLTWIFLGEIESVAEAEIKAVLAETTNIFAPLRINFSKAALFPQADRAHSLALTAENLTAEFQVFAEALRSALTPYCSKTENKSFRPHITLFRFNKESGRAEADLSVFNDYLPLVLPIEQIALIQSHLGKDKNSYEILTDYKLKAQS